MYRLVFGRTDRLEGRGQTWVCRTPARERGGRERGSVVSMYLIHMMMVGR